MFLIYVKGRGYFNGTSHNIIYENGKSSYEECHMKETFKCKFKREKNHVKSEFSYQSINEAKEKIKKIKEELQTWIDRGESKIETSQRTHWKSRKPYIYTKYYSYPTIKDLVKYIDKFEIEEVNDYLAPKRTARVSSKKNIEILTSNSDKQACDTCGLTFITGEAFLRIHISAYHRVDICRNCMFLHTDKLEGEYKKHPNHNDITTAWELEKISNGE